jgi:iron-sulfur cluster repair protein YtfE (RIC family)
MPMTEEDLLAAVREIAEGLAGSIRTLDDKFTALTDSVAKMKADAVLARNQGMENDMRRQGTLRSDAGRDDPDAYDQSNQTGARLTAADAVNRSEFASLARTVADMKQKSTRTSVDRNAVADLQAKADRVMRVHGDRAEPPMPGESTIDYSIRLARKMQPHSKVWKRVDLNLIAADQVALNNAIEQIRSDAYAAGESIEGMQLFQRREIVEQGPGGHTIRRFIGNGTMFKEMTRPVRHVAFIGTRSTSHL